jgi:predicted N-formylglutamate amidohydrolase
MPKPSAPTDTEARYPLIGPGEPPPVRLLNPGASAGVLFVADHASNRIPPAMGRLGLEPDQLDRHIAYDIGSAALAERLAERFDAQAVLAGYSRLLVDLNRSLEDPSAFPEHSDGVAIPGNQALGRDDKALRVRSFYTPYRVAIDRALRGLRSRVEAPALIALHSFTPELDGRRRPWQVGLLWDKDPRIAEPLIKGLRARPEGLRVGDNEPYSGKHPADYTIDHHAEAAGLPHVSIEVRQDLIAEPAGVERWADIIESALRPILDQPGLYRLRSLD